MRFNKSADIGFAEAPMLRVVPKSSRRTALAAALFLAVAVLGTSCLHADAQINEWVWMGGGSTLPSGGGQPGVYGTQGTPAPENVPGARGDASVWIDGNNNVWLFGGYGYDSAGTSGYLNDLWVFSTSTGEWTWMGGSATVPGLGEGQPGSYGTMGVPSATNVPGGRTSASSWIDSSGKLWLFGGNIYNPPTGGELSDLWEFNPSTREWTWVGGSRTPNQPSAPGTQGVLAAGNFPGARYGQVSWTDINGNFWFFGGQGYGSNGPCGCEGWLNDLWEFSPSTGEWGWISGNPSLNSGYSPQPGVYGTLGTPAAGNVPGGRRFATGWSDANGNLWLFGGTGYDSTGTVGVLNDLWEFNRSSHEWTWVSGSSTVGSAGGDPGVYGTLGAPAEENTPGARENASSWSDDGGNFWLFGGYGYDSDGNEGFLNDLWEFNPSTLEWTWTGGSSTIPGKGEGQPGVYGTLGIPEAENHPGGRSDASSWIDSSGNFWLFGGNVYDPPAGGSLNDLWQYTSATNSSTGPIAGISPASITFAPILVGTTANVQTVILSNTGVSVLTVTGIIASPEFAETNNCGNSVPAGGSCMINVSFTPSAGGAQTGTLTIDDNSNLTASSQTVALSGTGQDFTLVAPAAVTVSPGGSATYNVTLISQGAFSGTVQVTCSEPSGLNDSACTCQPNSLMLNDSTNPIVSVTVSTSGSQTASDLRPAQPANPSRLLAFPVWMAFGTTLTLVPVQTRIRRRRGRAAMPLAMLLVLICSSCGGSGTAGSQGNPGTSPGNYSLTVSATSQGITNTATLSLTVQ